MGVKKCVYIYICPDVCSVFSFRCDSTIMRGCSYRAAP